MQCEQDMFTDFKLGLTWGGYSARFGYLPSKKFVIDKDVTIGDVITMVYTHRRKLSFKINDVFVETVDVYDKAQQLYMGVQMSCSMTLQILQR